MPVAVVGAEEAAPSFAQLKLLQRLTGLLYVPLTPTFPHGGLLGMFGYLPAKFHIRFLDPIPTTQWGAEPWEDAALVQTVAEEVRALIQEELYRMLSKRRRSGSDESRRILVTGLSTYWGGRVAQALERERGVEAIIGVDAHDPTVELDRTEYVRVGPQHALLRRIVNAAEIDTVVDTRLVVDSTTTSAGKAHENNVISTMNILAACSGPESPVRRLVFKSSAHWYGCEQDDPAYFTEEMDRPHPAQTRIEQDIVEAEHAVRSFAQATPRATVTTLRFTNGSGRRSRPPTRGCSRSRPCRASSASTPATSSSTRTTSSAASSSPSARTSRAPTTAPATACWSSPRSPTCSASRSRPCSRRGGPARRPPCFAGSDCRIPPEMVNQLRFGRALDNRRLKAAGYAYRYTTREAVQAHAEAMRLRPLLGGGEEPYRYEREVEEFLRRSPTVRERPEPRWNKENVGVDAYEGLDAAELIELLPSLPRADLEAIGRHEAANARRPDVLAAIGRNLARTRSVTSGDERNVEIRPAKLHSR